MWNLIAKICVAILLLFIPWFIFAKILANSITPRMAADMAFGYKKWPWYVYVTYIWVFLSIGSLAYLILWFLFWLF